MSFCELSPDWEITENIEYEYIQHVTLKLKDMERTCEKCGSHRFKPNGFRETNVMDRPHQGKTVQLKLQYQRYVCLHCGDTSKTKMPALFTGLRITKRLAQYIVGRFMSGANNLKIASEVGLNVDRINRLVSFFIDQNGYASKFELPPKLAFLCYKADKILVIDVVDLMIVDVLADYSDIQAFASYITRLFDIEVVYIDENLSHLKEPLHTQLIGVQVLGLSDITL